MDQGSTTYEHQHTREEALLDPIPAQLALEAETADAALAEAETACRRVEPGRRFRLVEHSLPELDGEYVAISCSHECHSPRFAKAGELNHYPGPKHVLSMAEHLGLRADQRLRIEAIARLAITPES